ncbi:hypothetical protein BH160DRAFT_7360, partial [Burkholderia sp. H160]
METPMKKIAGSLTPPQWLTLAGVLALLVVVWFEGPLFAFNGHAPLESRHARWIAMALLVVAW